MEKCDITTKELPWKLGLDTSCLVYCDSLSHLEFIEYGFVASIHHLLTLDSSRIVSLKYHGPTLSHYFGACKTSKNVCVVIGINPIEDLLNFKRPSYRAIPETWMTPSELDLSICCLCGVGTSQWQHRHQHFRGYFWGC